MERLSDRIKKLELELEKAKLKIEDLSRHVEDKNVQPYSKVGHLRDRSQIRPIDIKTGFGQSFGGNMFWNNEDKNFPPWGQKPVNNPTEGYNKHSHSKFSGGALDVNTLKLIEYDIDWEANPNYNKHNQGLWNGIPDIATEQNDEDETIEKQGNFAFVFDPNTEKWYAYGIYAD